MDWAGNYQSNLDLKGDEVHDRTTIQRVMLRLWFVDSYDRPVKIEGDREPNWFDWHRSKRRA